MMPPPRVLICLHPRVTLNFDLVTRKVDRFMPLPHGLMVVCIEISSFVFKVLRLQI